MSFLTSQEIDHGFTPPLIVPFNENRIKHGAYELALGSEIFITNGEDKIKEVLSPGEQKSIPAGQFSLLLTDETLTIPNHILAFISIKSDYKIKGLINVSGFHVDPGFSGKLKFSVYNAGPEAIAIQQGEPIFIIWFARFSEPVRDPYNGRHDKQSQITSQDINMIQGEVPSPVALNKRLESLEVQFNRISGVLYALFAGVIIGVFMTVFRSCSDRFVDDFKDNSIALPIKSDTSISNDMNKLKIK